MFDLEKFKSDFETKRTTEATISQLKKTVDTVNKSLQPIEDRIKELFVETGLNQEGEYDSYSIVDNNYIKVIIRSGTNMNQATLPIDWLNDPVGTHSNTVQKSNKETVYKVICNKKMRLFVGYDSISNVSRFATDAIIGKQSKEEFAVIFKDFDAADHARELFASRVVEEWNKRYFEVIKYEDFDTTGYVEHIMEMTDDKGKILDNSKFLAYINENEFFEWQKSRT